MNKKILVAAMAAAGLAIVPMTASATDIKVYGHVGVNIANIDADSAVETRLEVNDPARGRVGVRATEDLGNGLQGIAQLEWMTRAHNAEAFQQQRESFVGLQGGFGRVALGQFNGAYKQIGGTGWDPFVTTQLENRNSTAAQGAYGHNSFMRNAIEYRTADLSGFRAIAQLQLLGHEDNAGEEAHGSYNLGASYKIGGIELIAAYAFSNAADLAGADDAHNLKAGVRWAEGPVGVFLTYEDANLGNVQGDLVNVGVTYRIGKNELYAHYGMVDSDVAGADRDAITLGVTHRMSRSFRIYGGLKMEDRDAAGDITTTMVGMRKDF